MEDHVRAARDEIRGSVRLGEIGNDALDLGSLNGGALGLVCVDEDQLRHGRVGETAVRRQTRRQFAAEHSRASRDHDPQARDRRTTIPMSERRRH